MGVVLEKTKKKSETDFCIFILYPATLLNLLFLKIVSLGFSIHYCRSFANRHSFISYFMICMPFISFHWLFAQARTSSTMSNKSALSKHPCLVPDLQEEKIQSFTIM